MSRQPGDMRPRPPDRQNGGGMPMGPDRSWRWVAAALLAIVVLALLVSNVMSATQPQTVSYGRFITELEHHQVTRAVVSGNSGLVTFTTHDGTQYETQGPSGTVLDLTESPLLNKYLGKGVSYTPSGQPWYVSLLPDLLLVAAFILLIMWMARRAQGQMGGIMSIGRSRAKVYTTERPRTTFADVAGYEGVKMEIREVVDFLRSSSRFKE
ncbi:MAG TPA: ATP-dependent metallopeptidase FtsH/Yme1/Tma family protein, partial [Acidimicrobiales bacterium]|nr:ATP-dependent metallopeptidase FtsH/Yme1/Tma family protein [Acidimicrobiales bacterium]